MIPNKLDLIKRSWVSGQNFFSDEIVILGAKNYPYLISTFSSLPVFNTPDSVETPEFKIKPKTCLVYHSDKINFKIQSNNLDGGSVDGKTKNFESEADFSYNNYFLRDGDNEVTMTLSKTGVELKKDGTKVENPTFTDLKLLETIGSFKQADDNFEIDLSAIQMERVLSKFKK